MGKNGLSYWFSLLSLGLVLSLPTRADILPLRDISGTAGAKPEPMKRVPTARVILADYDLLKKDFPQLVALTSAEIDQWLLEVAGRISLKQAAQQRVNSRISLSKDERLGYRPKGYGRSVVFRTGPITQGLAITGLIDAKGVGAVDPIQGDHSNGLMSLGEGIREYVYQKLIEMLFSHSHAGFKTVGSYAVLDFGFDIKNPDGTTSPAGAILRQGHDRAQGDGSLLNQKLSLAIEKVLRRYGITSAGTYRGEPSDAINIQGTKDGATVDYGGYLAVEKFEKTAIHFYGKKILIDPSKPGFVQPDPELRVPFCLWGDTETGRADPQYDNPWIWSSRLATDLRNGTATRTDVDAHVRNMLEPVAQNLAAHPLAPKMKQCEIDQLESALAP
jgi:hypothetical protein